jgi:hypothetical protein
MALMRAGRALVLALERVLRRHAVRDRDHVRDAVVVEEVAQDDQIGAA